MKKYIHHFKGFSFEKNGRTVLRDNRTDSDKVPSITYRHKGVDDAQMEIEFDTHTEAHWLQIHVSKGKNNRTNAMYFCLEREEAQQLRDFLTALIGGNEYKTEQENAEVIKL